jgi:alpha-beta hydrolase superfamily lysophospholipase
LEFLAEDPLSLHRATARFLLESTRLDAWLASQRWMVPTLIQLAGRERIIDNIATRRWVRRHFKGPRKIEEYPRAFHTLEFESDDSWRKDLLAWLDSIAEK